MKDIRKEIGTRVRILRQESGLTQEELAEQAGLHPTYIAKIESGERLPSLDVLKGLAVALDVPVTRIVEVIDDIPNHGAILNDIAPLFEGLDREEIDFAISFLRLLRQYKDKTSRPS